MRACVMFDPGADQEYGLQGATMGVANERVSTRKLASFDATLDNDLRRAFAPCPFPWVVGRTSGVRSIEFSSFERALPVSAVLCPKRGPRTTQPPGSWRPWTGKGRLIRGTRGRAFDRSNGEPHFVPDRSVQAPNRAAPLKNSTPRSSATSSASSADVLGCRHVRDVRSWWECLNSRKP